MTHEETLKMLDIIQVAQKAAVAVSSSLNVGKGAAAFGRIQTAKVDNAAALDNEWRAKFESLTGENASSLLKELRRKAAR